MGPNDSLKLKWQNDADHVSFQCESSEDDRISDFDLKLMEIESEHMEIPEQHYKVIARMPSSEFQKICRDLKEFGETMQVSASIALRYLANFAKAAPLCGSVELSLGPD